MKCIVAEVFDFLQYPHSAVVRQTQLHGEPLIDQSKKRFSVEKEFLCSFNLKFQQRPDGISSAVASQIAYCETKSFKILMWNINTISLYINTQILPKICQLKRGAYRVREFACFVAHTVENMQQDPSNRICRTAAIEQEVLECSKISPSGIHPKSLDQVEEQ